MTLSSLKGNNNIFSKNGSFFYHTIQLSSESCEGEDRMYFVNIYVGMTYEIFSLILITSVNAVMRVSFPHLSLVLDFRQMCDGETMKGRDCYYEESL